ncbi:MAG: RluA family pseudouridine synthase, partial [Limnothrix sp. RL_2_0]|nr:RluA family pseudouridine synthase [Limnothrix sp. RL_2_0]
MASLLHRYKSPEFADQVIAWYEGICPLTKELCRLPRTSHSEAIAYQLMEELALDERFSWEGKMYGVLLVEASTGERFFLKAFSGLLQGQKTVPGWVPPIDG